MQTGRLRLFNACQLRAEEFNLYHRKDGVIVKEHDDLLAATRYAIMSVRHAVPAHRVSMAVPPRRLSSVNRTFPQAIR